MGFFSKIKQGLQKTRDSIANGVNSVINSFTKIDEELFEELEETLVMSDIGVNTAGEICEKLRHKIKETGATDPNEIKGMLKEIIAEMLGENEGLRLETKPSVILVIGVNGVGKTTSIGKLASQLKRDGKNVVLGLATGATPLPFYAELVRMHKEEGLSFANVISFNLDEYSGLDRDHPESYWYFMHTNLFNHIDIKPENINLPSGTVKDDEIAAHCAAYEQKIKDCGGIDLQILGIGRTGHIGFNEPGSDDTTITRQVHLDELTRSDAAPAFGGIENVPTTAITMGVATIMGAREVALMAWGEKKASIVKKAVQGPVTVEVAASYLQKHPNAKFLLDKGAASQL